MVANSGNSLKSIQIFMFNEQALQPEERSPDTAYNEQLPSIVRLVK